MKRLWSRIVVSLVFSVFVSATLYCQGLTEENMDMKIPGTRWDVYGGLHFGAFDCNQTNKYPFVLGGLFIGQYTPRIAQPIFAGIQLGSFIAKGEEPEEHWGRTINMTLLDALFYVGYTLPLGKEEKLNSGYNLRLSLGLPYAQVIASKSTGKGYYKTGGGIGVGGFAMLELPNRLSIIGSVYRISKDLDGFGFKNDGSLIAGNKDQVTYIYKWGFLWNFIP